MLEFLYRFYERDVGSGEYRSTLLLAFAVVASSIGLLGTLATRPLHEVYTAEGRVEPGRVDQFHSEANGIIQQNRLQLGMAYEPGEPVFAMTSEGGDTPRIYAAPCRCVLTRSDLLHRTRGPVRVGELVAEFADTTAWKVRFPLQGRWQSSISPGAKVHVLEGDRASLVGSVERVYPQSQGTSHMEAAASVPGSRTLSPGSPVTVKVEVPPVSLWRLFVESLKRPTK
ncbi:HlyD family efflux transporter periplasmic adaptor subunit [Stigmatella sp. ncwal1]|uniref:HlyD family efflux transporter periplasmic adaptor subunit n=1 Tax=Stigmatella ashevillensis TaxID=2995309 RepID=A0ABT5DJ56_9BACT|nr:HlyD family efflux transporter periplasmic adaptor subunit [Stigmatella ashevillena]MDC0713195.1 HlyD family efflux transporter periplasmic adaptor subunit [Stigmatella ashevillena]